MFSFCKIGFLTAVVFVFSIQSSIAESRIGNFFDAIGNAVSAEFEGERRSTQFKRRNTKTTKKNVIFNGRLLSPQQISSLSATSGETINSGNYWYDPVSGFWGYQGGPSRGQMPSFLPQIEGALQRDASGGQTDVLVNGRAIHPMELHELQEVFGPIPPGSYMMNGRGEISTVSDAPDQQIKPLADRKTPQVKASAPVRSAVPQAAQRQPALKNIQAGRPSSHKAGSIHQIHRPPEDLRTGKGCSYVITQDFSGEVCP